MDPGLRRACHHLIAVLLEAAQSAAPLLLQSGWRVLKNTKATSRFFGFQNVMLIPKVVNVWDQPQIVHLRPNPRAFQRGVRHTRGS